VALAAQGPQQIPSHPKVGGFGEGKGTFSQAAGSAKNSTTAALPLPTLPACSCPSRVTSSWMSGIIFLVREIPSFHPPKSTSNYFNGAQSGL